MIRPADRAGIDPRLGRAGRRGLGGAFAASQPLARHALVFKARPAVSVDALSPFGRGANAPLAGRTILQIVPPLAAGGDERATLAVTAALAETGARALVATNSQRAGRRIAGDRRALRSLSGGDQESARDGAQHAPPSAHHRLGAGRPRPCALALGGLGGGQGLPQGEASACHLASRPMAAAPRPRTSFETAVAEGDYCHRVVRIRRGARGNPFSRRRPSASGSSVREWISPSFSRSG